MKRTSVENNGRVVKVGLNERCMRVDTLKRRKAAGG